MLLIILFLSLFSCICSHSTIDINNNKKFYYFAYGSNLLARRIHLNNPSAVFYSPAKLENHRLDFNMYDVPWNSAAATIVEDDKEHVWGSLWILELNQLKYLDRQEGVDEGWYFPKEVIVSTPDGAQVMARTYQESNTPNKTNKYEDLPRPRRPSNTYLEVIALGAIESHLPAEYIGYLFSIPTNGLMASATRRLELGYPF